MFDLNVDINKYFAEISKIPRGSGHEEKISKYLEDFAIEHKLKYYRDDANNVIIYKDAAKGYEDHPAVILQGHMDMVWEKGAESKHNFFEDPIELIEKDGYLYANDTTLGADDGVAVCYMLSILANDLLKHPALECIFTTGEETGFDGAFALDYSKLSAKRLISLDSEGEQEMFVSCSGGCTTIMHVPYKTQENDLPAYTLELSGLLGGHSGIFINKGRGNAIKLINRLMFALSENKIDYRIAEYKGGSKNNALATYAACTFVSGSSLEDIKAVIEESFNEMLEEYSDVEKTAAYKLSKSGPVNTCLDEASTQNIVNTIFSGINGCLLMSQTVEDLPVKSLNLGVLYMQDKEFVIEYCVRAVLDSSLKDINNHLLLEAKRAGGYASISDIYPGFACNKDSELRKKYLAYYTAFTGRAVKELAVPAGLEIGLFKKKIQGLDFIAIGPQMYDIHTSREHLDLSSFQRVYDVLTGFLATL